jgi:hypothetical protein
MEITLKDLSLLAKYGYTQFELATMDEREQVRILTAIREFGEADKTDHTSNDLDIWGLGPRTG